MAAKSIVFGFVLAFSFNLAVAQTNYRSVKSGDWNDPTTWQVEVSNSSGNWAAATSAPDYLSNVIRIQASHTVTITQNLTVDQTYIFEGGTLAVNDGVTVTLNNGPGSDLEHRANATLILYGEGHLAGAGIPIFIGNLYVHSLNPTGAITSGTGATGNIRTSGRNWSSQCFIYYSGSGIQYMGNGHPNTAGLTAVIQNTNGVHLNNTSLGLVGLGNLRIEEGVFTIENNNLTVSGNTEVVGGSASISSISASRTITFNNLILNGGDIDANAATNALTLNVNGSTDLSNGSFNLVRNGVGATINFLGAMALTNGDLNLTSSGNGNLLSTFSGDISGSGLINVSGISEVRLLGSGSLTHSFPISSSSTISTLRLDRPGCTLTIPYALNVGNLDVLNGAVILNANLTLNSQLNLATGTSLDISGRTLQIRNSLNSAFSGGQIISNSSSSLIFAKTGTINALSFAPGSSLGTLTLNRVATLTINEPITIATSLNLFAGILANTSSITMGSLAQITRSSENTFIGAAPLGGPYEIVYSGTDLTTGPEAQGSLADVTSNLTGALTLANDLNSTGTLRVNSGSFLSGDFNIYASDLFNFSTFSAPGVLATIGLVVSNEINNNGSFIRNGGDITLGGNFDNSATVTGTGDLIFNGATSFIGTLPTFTNITVSGVLNSPSTLTISGNLTNDGTINGLGTLVFTGTEIQTVAGTLPFEVGDIQISNVSSPISVSIDGFIYASGTVTLANGAVLDADGASDSGYLVLQSSASGDAHIAQLAEGTSISGSVTVQRRLAAADNTRWYFASPITNAAVAHLQDDFEVTGYFTGTDYPCEGCEMEGANLKWYLESVKGALSRGYQAMPQFNGTNEENLVPGRGYEAFIWNGEDETLIDVRGPLNQGTVNYSVTHTPSNPVEPNADGWNLIGNPFASPIQWGTTGWTRSGNIDPTVWVWDVLAGVWRSYNYNDAGPQSLDNGIIASGQGFWVYVHPGAATLSINESAKASSQGVTFYRKKSSEEPDGLKIMVFNDALSDEVYLKAHKGAGDGFDLGLDAFKPRLGHEKISLAFESEASQNLHYQATNPEAIRDRYDLSLVVKQPGQYRIAIEQKGTMFADFVLVDHYLGQAVPMNQGLQFDVTSDPKSMTERFSIMKGSPFRASEGSVNLYHAYPNPVFSELFVDSHSDRPLKIFWMNNLGQLLVSKDLVGNEQVSLDVASLAPGVYFLKVVTQDDKIYISKVVKR